MPAHPVHKALPGRLVAGKPLSGKGIPSNNLEDEFEGNLHPSEVRAVGFDRLDEARKPASPATCEVLVVSVEKHLEQAEERP